MRNEDLGQSHHNASTLASLLFSHFDVCVVEIASASRQLLLYDLSHLIYSKHADNSIEPVQIGERGLREKYSE